MTLFTKLLRAQICLGILFTFSANANQVCRLQQIPQGMEAFSGGYKFEIVVDTGSLLRGTQIVAVDTIQEGVDRILTLRQSGECDVAKKLKKCNLYLSNRSLPERYVIDYGDNKIFANRFITSVSKDEFKKGLKIIKLLQDAQLCSK